MQKKNKTKQNNKINTKMTKIDEYLGSFSAKPEMYIPL